VHHDLAIDETIDSIAELERRALAETPRHQRVIDRITLAIGRPRVAYLAGGTIVVWMLANLILAALRHPLDPPPFPWLATLLAVASVLITLMILISSNRGDALDEQRDRLALQIALLTDRKTAKIIALLEELRRDTPSVRNRHDAEANSLSQATDPHAVAAELERRRPNRAESGQ
jgi:uncharacterized membrane protein